MANYLLFLLHSLIFAAVFFGVPLMAPEKGGAIYWLVPLLALFTNQHWSLLHECIHGSFSKSRAVNNHAGRALGIFFCSSFTLVRASHLLHHQVNRTEIEQLELYKEEKVPLGANLNYYFGLFFGLFLSEFFGTVLFLLPKAKLEALRAKMFSGGGFASNVFSLIMDRPGKLEAIRIDGALVLLTLLIAFLLYGSHGEFLVVFLVIRMVLVSFLDYLYHYGTPVGDPLHGYNLELPAPLSKFLLHFNLHGVHHKNPGAPWHELPGLFEKSASTYDGSYRKQALHQLKGLKPKPH